MRNLVWLVMFFLVFGCCAAPPMQNVAEAANTATSTSVPTLTFTTTPTTMPTARPTSTPMPTATTTPTASPTPTLLPTAYTDGSLNCRGSVALMYHRIDQTPKLDGLTASIDSFEKVIIYLVENGYYFPTPEEFASDIKLGVCRHKYAIITIDDSWNDPQSMGVLDVLTDNGGGKGPGAPNVWFGVITRKISVFSEVTGEQTEPWTHIDSMTNTGLVYPVSHSQTHPAGLINTTEYYSEENNLVYAQIADELYPSRKDIFDHLELEPLFFIYPGGNVSEFVTSRMGPSGYVGGFTVTPGGLDGSYPNYLPRVNGAIICKNFADNSSCVIDVINELSR